jgi:hypothetical protein
VVRKVAACDDGLALIPLQIFWLKDGQPSFDENNSVHLNVKPGANLLDMRGVAGWHGGQNIVRLRVDIDAGQRCTQFTLSPPELGISAAQ